MKIGKLSVVTITVFLVILLVILLNMNTSKQEVLFSVEDIDPANITTIEVIDYHTNERIVSADANFIKQVSSVLTNKKSDNITESNINRERLLNVMHIANIGYYPNSAIGVYQNYVV